MNTHRRLVLTWAALLGISAAVGVLAGPAADATGAPAGPGGTAATRTVVSTANPAAVFGQVVHVKAVVHPVLGTGLPTGTVNFRDGAAALGSVQLAAVNGVEVAKLTLTSLTVGTHQISASYQGSGAWAASTSLSVTVTVSRDITTTSVTPVADPVTPGKYNLNAKVKIGSPGVGPATGVATYIIDGGPGQAVALGAGGRCHLTVTFTPGSRHTVRVDYGGDGTAQTSSGSVTFTA